jgi:hypothetical protein
MELEICDICSREIPERQLRIKNGISYHNKCYINSLRSKSLQWDYVSNVG